MIATMHTERAMLAEQIKRDIRIELILCHTRRDVRRVFDAAENEFRVKDVSSVRKQEVLEGLRRDLTALLGPKDDPGTHAMVVEAGLLIDRMLSSGVGKPPLSNPPDSGKPPVGGHRDAPPQAGSPAS